MTPRKKANLHTFKMHAPELAVLEQGVDFKVLWLDVANNIFCIVDPSDYDTFRHWAWGTTFNSTGRKLYATRNTRLQGRSGPQVKLYMHKEILALCCAQTHPRGAGQIIGDHINGNSLDNRRSNLRWATPSENGLNRFRRYHNV